MPSIQSRRRRFSVNILKVNFCVNTSGCREIRQFDDYVNSSASGHILLLAISKNIQADTHCVHMCLNLNVLAIFQLLKTGFLPSTQFNFRRLLIEREMVIPYFRRPSFSLVRFRYNTNNNNNVTLALSC